MTYKKHNKRPRNWRISKQGQLFGAERHFRLLEKIFWNYNKIKLLVTEEIRARQIYLSACRADGGGGGKNSISRPTEALAMRELEEIKSIEIGEGLDKEPIDDPEKWITVVEETLKHFKQTDETVRDVLYRRFILNEGYPRTCIDLEITPNKYYKARDVGLQFARECAIQLGLVNAFEPQDENKEPLRNPPTRTNY